jgi:hypothetical protein
MQEGVQANLLLPCPRDTPSFIPAANLLNMLVFLQVLDLRQRGAPGYKTAESIKPGVVNKVAACGFLEIREQEKLLLWLQ